MVSLAQDLERGLVEAGVSDEQAKRIALGLDERISAMATKEDVIEMRDSLRRELDLILATMEDRFRAQDQLQEVRMRAQDQRFGERFNLVDSHFALIEQRFGVMERHFEVLEERAGLAEQRLNSIDNRLSDHDARFDELIGRFDMLERTMWRVFMLMFGFLTAVFGGLMYAAFG